MGSSDGRGRRRWPRIDVGHGGGVRGRGEERASECWARGEKWCGDQGRWLGEALSPRPTNSAAVASGGRRRARAGRGEDDTEAGVVGGAGKLGWAGAAQLPGKPRPFSFLLFSILFINRD